MPGLPLSSIPRPTPPKVPSPPPSNVLPYPTFLTTTRSPATSSVTARPASSQDSSINLPKTTSTNPLPGDQTQTATVDEPGSTLLQSTTVISKENDTTGWNTETADAFGGALDDNQGDKENTDTSVASPSTQIRANDGLAGTQEGQTSDGLQATLGGEPQTSAQRGDVTTPTAGPDGATQQTATSPNRTFVIGGVISGVIAVIVLVAIILLCLRRRRKRLELEQDRPTRSAIQSLDPLSREDWSRFHTTSPTQEKHELQEKPELSVEEVVEKFKSKNTSDIADALVAMMAADSSNASNESNHKLHSHYQDVMPPPSMRSKRYSRATTHTFQSESEHASSNGGFGTLHPLDSQTELSYPFERSPSSASAFSNGTAPPMHVFGASLRDSAHLLSQTAPKQVATVMPMDLDFGSVDHSRNSSTNCVLPFSQTSTMTSISLGTVGSGVNVGRAL